MRRREQVVGLSFILVALAASMLLLGARTARVRAQSAIGQVVRTCLRGTDACNSLEGRTWVLTHSQEGSLIVPAGCGDISPATGATVLPFHSSIVVQPHNPAIQMIGSPRYDGAQPGDRIDITSDQEQCCLNPSGDAVRPCQNYSGELTVREIGGPLR